MTDVHQEARRILRAIFCSLPLARPRRPIVLEDEIKEMAVRSGMSPAVFDELRWSYIEEHRVKKGDGFTVGSEDWGSFLSPGGSQIPSDLIPVAALKSVEEALVRLERRHGKDSAKSLAMFAAECSGVSSNDLEIAVALLVSLRRLKPTGDGYRGELQAMGYERRPARNTEDPMADRIRRQLPIVVAVLAEKDGDAAPESSALDRFGLYLAEQGLTGLAAWWAEQVRELRIAGDSLPTASTVLAGALLEAALVACAFPAKTEGHWKQRFLSRPPEKWKLGELIDQAEAAASLSSSDVNIARSIAEFRNRIHVGKYSAEGEVPTSIPAINANEARLVTPNLERVLDRLLEWVKNLEKNL